MWNLLFLCVSIHTSLIILVCVCCVSLFHTTHMHTLYIHINRINQTPPEKENDTKSSYPAEVILFWFFLYSCKCSLFYPIRLCACKLFFLSVCFFALPRSPQLMGVRAQAVQWMQCIGTDCMRPNAKLDNLSCRWWGFVFCCAQLMDCCTQRCCHVCKYIIRFVR